MLKSTSRSKIRRLNLRQRKKHHVADFREYTVYYKATFSKPWKYEELEEMIDKFFDAAEKYGFQVCGFGGGLVVNEFTVMICGLDSKILLSNTKELGQIIMDFDPGAHVVSVLGPDAWYGDFDNFDEEAEFKSQFALTIHPRK